MYCDEYLLDRLRVLVTDNSTNQAVRSKAQNLYIGWAQNFKGVRGYERLVALHKQVPMRSRKPRPQPKYLSNDLRDLEDDDDDDHEHDRHNRNNNNNNSDDGGDDSDRNDTRNSRSGHSAPPLPPSSSKPSKSQQANKRSQGGGSRSRASSSAAPAMPKINLAKERPLIQKALAESNFASTNLTNALKLINWQRELSTENKAATTEFKHCRTLRKIILRYIHSIESDEFIGALIHANEELITALKKYDEMSRPPDYDSDSDESDYDGDDWKVESDRMKHLNIGPSGSAGPSSSGAGNGASSSGHSSSAAAGSAQTKRNKYPDTESESEEEEEEDENNPFGDSHAI